jgi:DNA-binding transcriptional ArsR family regulator
VTRVQQAAEQAAAASDADADVVFKALADGTRRGLLDALFVLDGQSVQSLCARVPGMTRFGVMKHLGVLEEANLVTTRRAGRSKQHFLNPVPIQQVADRWVGKYAQPFTRALVDLHDALTPRSHDTHESTRESA